MSAERLGKFTKSPYIYRDKKYYHDNQPSHRQTDKQK